MSKKDQGMVVLSDEGKEIAGYIGDESEFGDIRDRIVLLCKNISQSRWELAEKLYDVYDRALYERWGYHSFSEYIETETTITPRTAKYLTSVYNCFWVQLGEGLVESKKKNLVESIQEIGLSKAKSLMGIITDENMDEWFEKAKSMSLSELDSEVKKELLLQSGDEESDVDVAKTKSFRFFEEQLVIVEQALEIAGELSESKKRGHNMTLICQDFLAMSSYGKEASVDIKGRYLDRIGAALGFYIIAVDKEGGKIVHNVEKFDELKNA